MDEIYTTIVPSDYAIKSISSVIAETAETVDSVYKKEKIDEMMKEIHDKIDVITTDIKTLDTENRLSRDRRIRDFYKKAVQDNDDDDSEVPTITIDDTEDEEEMSDDIRSLIRDSDARLKELSGMEDFDDE